MRNTSSTLALILLLGCGSGRSTSEKRDLCDALAVTATALNDAILKQTTGEYAAVESAMQKWAQWTAKSVTPEQDGTGEFSGAWQRAYSFKRGGDASCAAARVAAWQLVELGRLTKDRDVIDALRPLDDNFSCASGTTAIDSEASKRKRFQNEWEGRRSRLEAAARDGVTACFKKFGGTPAQLRVPEVLPVVE